VRIRFTQFLAIILTALALVPGGAHVLELAHPIDLDQQQYLTVQAIYRGWSLLGGILIAAVLTNLTVALMIRDQRAPMLSAAAAAILLLATLAVFFIWTYPVNQTTANWTAAPEQWQMLRRQWEYSHAVNAALTFLALCASTASGLLASK
jgi:hypothetical protein